MSLLCMSYSKVDQAAQMLIFSSLEKMLSYFGDETFFTTTVKKMYMEFTKESKTGGGGHAVLNQLRIAQNCFVEILKQDLKSSY